MTPVKTGDVVACRFLDHAEGADEPIEFIAYGRVAKKATGYLVIQSWCYPDSYDMDDNVTQYVILRNSVLSLRVLT